jgi:hypothetical protein
LLAFLTAARSGRFTLVNAEGCPQADRTSAARGFKSPLGCQAQSRGPVECGRSRSRQGRCDA